MLRYLPSGASRLLDCGVPSRVSGRIRKQINQWIECSGPEWTTGRLKSYREAAYQLRAGNQAKVVALYQENSISYNKSTLIPKGVLGLVVRGFVSAKKPAIIRKYDALLRIYTCIRLDTLSKRQIAKSFHAINNCVERTAEYERLDTHLSLAIEKYASRLKDVFHFESPLDEGGKVITDLSKLHPVSATHISRECLVGFENPISDNSWGKHVASIWTSVWIPDSLKAINPAEKMRELLEKSGADCTTAGHIAFIQEGGCKGRVVAVPNAWIQVLMRPLHLSLDKLARRVHASCMHDQNRGAYFCKTEMEKGNKLFSLDLSSATDRFPRSLQTAFLRGLGLPQYAEAVEEISTAPWIPSTGDNRTHRTWSYSVGQPMGMYSSFPLFHLTHIVLLDVLKRLLREKGKDGDFRILGDDCIIVGEDLARMYHKALSTLGVKFSAPKCISSKDIAEFAGFSIIRTNKGITSYRPFKYSGRHGWGAASSLLNSFGKGVKVLGPWYSRKLETFNLTRGWRNPDLSPVFNPLVLDDDQPAGVNLNSHRLGSLSNRLNYSLNYEPLADLLECYESQQIILLGQKEIVSEGFASANLNTQYSPGREPDHIGDPEPSFGAHKVQLSSDPLMKPDSAELLREISASHAFCKEEGPSEPDLTQPSDDVTGGKLDCMSMF